MFYLSLLADSAPSASEHTVLSFHDSTANLRE
jgi:hypothetical protein